MAKCPTCNGSQIVGSGDEAKPCPALSVTALGRLACKLPDGTFDSKKQSRDINNAKQQKDKAYEERDRVVAALAKAVIKLGGKAGLKKTPIEGWNPAWFNCVYVEPKGGPQFSWHIHERELPLFQGLPQFTGEWDGHDNPTKYKRLEEWKP